MKLLDRIMSEAPELLRLTFDETARLEAYLKNSRQRWSASRYQNEPRYRQELEQRRAERQHLRAVLDYNKALATDPRAGGGSGGEYSWARQADVVSVTNRVLEFGKDGEQGKLYPGTLSDPRTDGRLKTELRNGNERWIEIDSFLDWLHDSRKVEKDELKTLKVAIIAATVERSAE